MTVGPEIIALAAREIKDLFVGQRVRRVDAGGSWAALTLSRDRALFFSWDAEASGICEASQAKIRAAASISRGRPTIGDALKSHLLGAEIVDAEAPSRDRVIKISFRRPVGGGVATSRTLIVEATGRYANVALLDERGAVIEAAKHIHGEQNRYRLTLPGLAYELPPAIDGVMIDDFDPRSRAPIDKLVGAGRPLLAAIARDGAEDLIPALASGEGEMIYQVIGRDYVSAFPKILSGSVVLAHARALDALRRATVDAMIERSAEATRRRIAAAIDKAARSVARKIADEERAEAGERDAIELMEIGRMILASAHEIAPRSDRAELTDWSTGEPIARVVDLDPKLDAPANAEKYFTRYRKRKAAAERARGELVRLRAEEAHLAEQSALLECHSDVATLRAMEEEIKPDARAKAQTLPPHGRLDISSSGASLYWGLSAKGNHYVTSRVARPDDIWFHAQGIPGAHVILRVDRELDDEEMEGARMLAASCASRFSRAKGETIRVDFTERRHVRPIPGGGGALVTYKNFSTISVDGSIFAEMIKKKEDEYNVDMVSFRVSSKTQDIVINRSSKNL